jgi:hypothetical protein
LKIYPEIFFITFFSLFIIIGCEEETPNEPPVQNYPDYYPDGIGSYLKYRISEKDTLGGIIQQGNRVVYYTGTSTHNGREYITQADTLLFDTLSSFNTYLFRKSDTGVFYAVDTNQVSQLIPDSLKQYVLLRDEMQLLFYPLTNGSTWSLYRVTADIQPDISIKLLDVVASFEKSERLILIWPTGSLSVYTQKVKYELELYSDIGSPPEIYTAYMWFAENIGLVKFEGNQFILSIAGGGISFEPSSNVLIQEIIAYDIK